MIKENDININEIKEDGKAGLYYAYDAITNIYTSANDSVNGRSYKCPICGCLMHPTTTKTGRRIFARNSGHDHTNPLCITLYSKGIKRSFEGLNPTVLITSLCRPTSRKKKSDDREANVNSPNSDSKVTIEKDDEYKCSPFTSLEQISKSGIDFLNADDMQGDYKVSDFIITYKYGKKFFTDPNFRLGARIVYAKFIFSSRKQQSLIFSMFKENSFSVRFRLVFTKPKDFNTYNEKFGEWTEDNTGRTTFKYRKAQYVLIACDNWYYIGKPDCENFCSKSDTYCTSCCGMYQAVFTNSKQLYLVSTPVND